METAAARWAVVVEEEHETTRASRAAARGAWLVLSRGAMAIYRMQLRAWYLIEKKKREIMTQMPAFCGSIERLGWKCMGDAGLVRKCGGQLPRRFGCGAIFSTGGLFIFPGHGPT